MTVHFSKTEQDHEQWICTIPNKGIQKDEKGFPVLMPKRGDSVLSEELNAVIDAVRTYGGNAENIEIKISPMKGIPAVGIEYTIERK